MDDELKQFHERQNKVENEIATFQNVASQISESVATLGTKFTHLESLVSTLFRKLEQFTEKFSANQKTPWSTLISFAGLIFVIIGAVLAPLYFRISKLETEVSNLKNTDLVQADLNGYQRAQLEILMKERQ